MKVSSIVRLVLKFVAILSVFALPCLCVVAQDVGVDVGGGAGVFRAKNPETKKRPPRTPPVGGAHRLPRATTAPGQDRVEDLLDKGNGFRDAHRFAESEQAYNSVLKIKPRDGRAAYGLGNIYSDQQRWEEAETAYRNAAAWSPTDVDALVALSVVLVQPRTGADNAKRFADAESFSRRAIQLQPKMLLPGIVWGRVAVARFIQQ